MRNRICKKKCYLEGVLAMSIISFRLPRKRKTDSLKKKLHLCALHYFCTSILTKYKISGAFFQEFFQKFLFIHLQKIFGHVSNYISLRDSLKTYSKTSTRDSFRNFKDFVQKSCIDCSKNSNIMNSIHR